MSLRTYAMTNDYRVDPEREKEFPETGIYIRAKRGDEWVSADIAHLDRASLNVWLSLERITLIGPSTW